MKAIIFGLSILILSSCTNQIKEVQELRNEIRSREIEISSIYGSPGYQFGQAMEYFDAKDFAEAEKLLSALQNKFPDWNKEIVADILKKTKEMKD
ncbi:MAG: hypothetical protein Fur0015_07880 [Ignavibacteriales bacterium]